MVNVLETYGRVVRDPRHESLTVVEGTPTRPASLRAMEHVRFGAFTGECARQNYVDNVVALSAD